jgi:hypothetical protein
VKRSAPPPPPEDPHLPQSGLAALRIWLIGRAKDFRDPQARHKLALIAFLAWVGLGADGLSSSAYGPDEAFRALGAHTYLAVFLALATVLTIFVISRCYTRIIEHFPQGGGGYVVASSLLGGYAGLASGCALLVDYVLTITTSIAGGGDAVFSLLPVSWQGLKLPVEFVAIVLLIVMNLRGVKESVTLIIPVFLVFLLTHAVLIGGGILSHAGQMSAVVADTQTSLRTGLSQLGLAGLLLVFLKAYSLGGGTYTGIEAVSNGLAILRDPKVETGRRTMAYMATSLAVTAGGLFLCYLLFQVTPQPGRTLNAVLADAFAGAWRPGGVPLGPAFVVVTIGVEAVLLLVAAQTGFIDGPRVMANMATDSWLPRRFAGLSDRLTMQNGIVLMGAAALVILSYTRGHIGLLLVMYSLNVFITFTLSQLAMMRFWTRRRRWAEIHWRDLATHTLGFFMCAAILCIMVVEKFRDGAWVTVLITTTLFALCVAIRRHYAHVAEMVRDFDRQFDKLPAMLQAPAAPEWDKRKATAIVLVGGYGGLGIHIFFSNMRLFQGAFHNFVFASVGSVDSEFFKDEKHVDTVERQTRAMLDRYVELAARARKPARAAFRMGTDITETASELCLELSRQHPQSVVFAGTLVFERPHWFDRILHNETAFAIQRRLKFGGVPMVILPLLIRDPRAAARSVLPARAGSGATGTAGTETGRATRTR